jgi:hypothetical protein
MTRFVPGVTSLTLQEALTKTVPSDRWLVHVYGLLQHIHLLRHTITRDFLIGRQKGIMGH